MSQERPDPNDLLKRRGGGATVFSFPTETNKAKDKLLKEITIEGDVLDREVTQETEGAKQNYAPKYWDKEETKPKWQLVITLQTSLREDGDDDGKRRIFAKFKMLEAIRDAVEAVEAVGVEVGGWLRVTHDDIIPPEDKMMSPTKLFTAKYVSAADRLVQTGGVAPKAEAPVEEPKAAPPAEEPSDVVDPAAAQAALAALPLATRKLLGLA